MIEPAGKWTSAARYFGASVRSASPVVGRPMSPRCRATPRRRPQGGARPGRSLRSAADAPTNLHRIVSSTTITNAAATGRALRAQVSGVVAVRDDVLEPLLIALVAGGHSLIEGVPGVGKTLLARALAASVDCAFNRIQFTNDLMPSDIVGSAVWKARAEKFVFVRGPLFANLVLADEINRTSPRTLSCLLEAMENGVVSIEGKLVRLGDPFCVLATRNPIEFHGTYPVPEAALDRFLVRVELDYPDA